MADRKVGEITVPTEPVSRATKITGFTFKSYDKNAGVLQFNIENQDGSPTDLIDATVRLFMYIYQGEEKKEFPIFDNEIITESYMQGIVKYPIPDMLLSYEGKVDANIYIDFPDGSHTDNLAFTFNIEKSAIDGEIQANGDYYFKDFQQLLESVKKEATDAVNEALLGVDQTISEAEQKLDDFVQSASKDVTETISQLTAELESTETEVTNISEKANQLQTDLASVQNELTNAEEYFVKQESLEKGPLLFKNTQITTQNWNDIQDVGIYYCAGSSGENMPTRGPLYGYLTVKKISSVTQQTYETGISIYIRSLTGNPQTWSNWHEIALAEKTVSLSEDQEIDGVKIFLKTPMVNQIPVLVNNELPFEAWYGTGKELTNIPHKARLVIGDEVTTIGKQQNRAMRKSPLVWNSGRWEAEVVRDCTLLIEGLARLQFGGSSSGKYAYLIFYRDDEETNQIGYAGGTGDSTNVLQWKHGIHFSRIFEAKAGSMFSIVYEGEESKKVDFAQINTLHIMEIES